MSEKVEYNRLRLEQLRERERSYTSGPDRTLHHHAGEFYTWDGTRYPVADVAARLNVPLETARTRLRRPLAQLRERFADDADGRHAGLFAGLIAMVNRRQRLPAAPSTPGAAVPVGWWPS